MQHHQQSLFSLSSIYQYRKLELGSNFFGRKFPGKLSTLLNNQNTSSLPLYQSSCNKDFSNWSLETESTLVSQDGPKFQKSKPEISYKLLKKTGRLKPVCLIAFPHPVMKVCSSYSSQLATHTASYSHAQKYTHSLPACTFTNRLVTHPLQWSSEGKQSWKSSEL